MQITPTPAPTAAPTFSPTAGVCSSGSLRNFEEGVFNALLTAVTPTAAVTSYGLPLVAPVPLTANLLQAQFLNWQIGDMADSTVSNYNVSAACASPCLTGPSSCLTMHTA